MASGCLSNTSNRKLAAHYFYYGAPGDTPDSYETGYDIVDRLCDICAWIICRILSSRIDGESASRALATGPLFFAVSLP